MRSLALIGLVSLSGCIFSPVSEPFDRDGGAAGSGGGSAGGAAGGAGAGTGGGTAGGGSGAGTGGGGSAHCLDADRDGYVAGAMSSCSSKPAGDCNDNDPSVNPAAAERCNNQKDDDCDGLVDGNDPQCKQCTGGGGGLSCATWWDCGQGSRFCDKKSGGTQPACCSECPLFDGDCVIGTAPQPHGIDPMTGCRETACINSNLACPAVYQPVCGMNGQTYGNSCELSRAQVEKLHDGECAKGENLDCGYNGPEACGKDGTLYCRDACPICDAWVMRCTKVGVCVYDTDCPAGMPPPPTVCPDGSLPRATCGAATHACSWSCP